MIYVIVVLLGVIGTLMIWVGGLTQCNKILEKGLDASIVDRKNLEKISSNTLAHSSKILDSNFKLLEAIDELTKERDSAWLLLEMALQDTVKERTTYDSVVTEIGIKGVHYHFKKIDHYEPAESLTS